METVADFIFLGSKITVDGDCSHEIKRCNYFVNKCPSSQGCGFSSSHVWMWEVNEVKLLSRVRLFATPWTVAYQAPPSMGFSRQEYWSGVPFTVKNAESQRIDAFELWCWRRLLRVPWTARKSNQSILKEISPEYSLDGLMLKLKLQYFGHLVGRTDCLEKTLMMGKIESRRRKGRQRMRWLDGITHSDGLEFEQAPGVGDGQGALECCSPWGRKESDPTERLNWTDRWKSQDPWKGRDCPRSQT